MIFFWGSSQKLPYESVAYAAVIHMLFNFFSSCIANNEQGCLLQTNN